MLKKKKFKIPRTVEFCGRKLKVQKGKYIERFIALSDSEDVPVIEVFLPDEDIKTFGMFFGGVEGEGETFEKALRKLEPKVLKYFKELGEALNYDVEN